MKYTGTYIGTGLKIHALRNGNKTYCGKQLMAKATLDPRFKQSEITCIRCQNKISNK